MADTLLKHAPAAKPEVDWLKDLTIGQSRTGPLFPGLPEDIVWTLVERTKTQWMFEGVWCGVPMMDVIITETSEALMLTTVVENPDYLTFPVRKEA
jgi:hypothetical protein